MRDGRNPLEELAQLIERELPGRSLVGHIAVHDAEAWSAPPRGAGIR